MTNPESTPTPSSATTSPRCSGGGTWSELGIPPTPPWTPDRPRDLTAALAPAGKPLLSTATMWNDVEPECTPTPDPVTSEPEIERAPEPESPVLAAVAAAEHPDLTVVVEIRTPNPPSRRGWLDRWFRRVG
jgi:hypothetical protein